MFLTATTQAPAGDSNELTGLLLALIPALAAMAAAVIAARSAFRVKRAESEASRVRELENRIAQRKYEVYEPIIELLRQMMDPKDAKLLLADQDGYRRQLSKFSAWAAIFASDEAVELFQQFMQATYKNPPAPIIVRLYAEFVLAARRDMGYPDTAIKPEHIMGIRLNDIYEDQWIDAMRISFANLCQREGWTPPWSDVPAT